MQPSDHTSAERRIYVEGPGNAHADALVAGRAGLEEHFRRDVGERAHEAVAHHAGRFGGHRFRDAEVDELELPLHEEEIARLEVAVDYVLLVNRVHRSQHLLPHQADEVHVQRLARLARARQVGLQVRFAAFQQLRVRTRRESHDVESVLGFVQLAVDQLDYPRSAAQRLQQGHFVQEIVIVDLVRRIAAQLHAFQRQHIVGLADHTIYLAAPSLAD